MYKITIYDIAGHIEDDFTVDDIDSDLVHSMKQEMDFVGNMFLIETMPKDENDEESRARPFD